METKPEMNVVNNETLSVSKKVKKILIIKEDEPIVEEEIKTQKIRGLGFVEEWKRVYPNDQLLSTTLGFVGKEGQGLEGLELFYDDQKDFAEKTRTLTGTTTDTSLLETLRWNLSARMLSSKKLMKSLLTMQNFAS